MQINGEWLICDDGIVRPVVRGEILAANGSWVPVPFLLDTGADRTVFSKRSPPQAAGLLKAIQTGIIERPQSSRYDAVGCICESLPQ